MGTRLCVVPDLGDEQVGAFTLTEELLMLLAAWEEEAAEEGADDWSLPSELGGGVALEAVRRLWDAVKPSQGEFYSGSRWLATDGRYELGPLSFLDIDQADLDVLAAAASALGRPPRSTEAGEALEEFVQNYQGPGASFGHAKTLEPGDVVATAARIHGLLEPYGSVRPRDASLVVGSSHRDSADGLHSWGA